MPIQIELENIGRRFNREWIFRGVGRSFVQGESYAILGANGSGKSTLLQIIAGILSQSEGSIVYRHDGMVVGDEQIFKFLTLAAPYQELIEEFTLIELIEFHFQFKQFRKGYDANEVIRLLGFEKSKHKAFRFFSSGMKQRTKLALAFCSDTPILLLDEPTSNLDKGGVDWYTTLINSLSNDRLLIICSNQEHEYNFCRHSLEISAYK